MSKVVSDCCHAEITKDDKCTNCKNQVQDVVIICKCGDINCVYH